MTGPLTLRQHLLVVLAMLCMVALQANRKYIPYWLRPEFYELREGQRAAFARLGLKRVDLEGRPNLLVGDSMVVECRWTDTDVLSQPGSSPKHIGAFMAQNLAGRHYRNIIIWVGTAGRDEFLSAVPDMVRDAAPHAARVHVLGPMPTDAPPAWFPKEALWFPLPQEDATQLAADLQRRLPHVRVVDISFLMADSTNLSDGVHLNAQGFAVLRAQLEKQGIL